MEKTTVAIQSVPVGNRTKLQSIKEDMKRANHRNLNTIVKCPAFGTQVYHVVKCAK